MRLRVHHKLFLSYSLLVAAVIVALTIGVDRTLRRPLIDQAAGELLRELALGRELYDRTPGTEPDALARELAALTGHRVSAIAPDGTVVGDSDVGEGRVAELENHADRPEFRDALTLGSGTAVRESASVDRELLYAAIRTGRGEVLRFAVGIEEIDAAVARVRRQILQVGAVALVLAAVFSLSFSIAVTGPLRRIRSIAAAMAGGDLSVRVRPSRRDELGDVGAALDALADELQRRLSDLEEEREEMQTLIDSMAEGVLAVGPDGTVLRANPAARAIFGLEEEFGGAAPEVVARRTTFVELIRRAAAGEAVSPIELAHDGKHLLCTAAPLPRGGAVLVFLDITELRRLEGVRRDFVANVSHELKTPLTVIRGHGETLLDEDLPPELRRRFAGVLLENAERLQGILDDLLDLSRIESGGWTPRPEPVEIDRVAREAWRAFSDRARERGVSFEVRAEPDAARVHADAAALRQVFSNLFSNALRHTPEGGRIDVRSRSAGPGWVRVEVRDDGSGIPEIHQGRIFERFYRVDPARSRSEGGTGLGLSIVRHLVERHGGEVGVESVLGEGTTIRFTLSGAEPGGEG